MTAPVPPTGASPELPLATPQQRARFSETAEKFEAQMISLMLKPMFDTLSADGPFGGGQAEGTYRSFLVDAVGKQIARAGGIGMAQPVMREMLRLQGLR
jgi:Rod binding domain-containing protein